MRGEPPGGQVVGPGPARVRDAADRVAGGRDGGGELVRRAQERAVVGVDLDRGVVGQCPGQLVLPTRSHHPVAHRHHGRRGHVDRRDPVVRGERGADLERDQRVEQRHPAHPGQRPGAGLRVQVVVEQGGAEGVGAERVERGRPGGGGDGPGQHQSDGALPRRTADVARGRAQHHGADQVGVPLPEQLGDEAAHRVAGRDDPAMPSATAMAATSSAHSSRRNRARRGPSPWLRRSKVITR